MRIQRLVLAMFVVAGLGSAATAADDNKKLIVGKWEVTKADEGSVSKGSTAEFGKDGKIKVTHKKDDASKTVEGTYTVEGDILSLMIKAMNNEDGMVKITIKKISATEMTVEGPDGKSVTFTKK